MPGSQLFMTPFFFLPSIKQNKKSWKPVQNWYLFNILIQCLNKFPRKKNVRLPVNKHKVNSVNQLNAMEFVIHISWELWVEIKINMIHLNNQQHHELYIRCNGNGKLKKNVHKFQSMADEKRPNGRIWAINSCVINCNNQKRPWKYSMSKKKMNEIERWRRINLWGRGAVAGAAIWRRFVSRQLAERRQHGCRFAWVQIHQTHIQSFLPQEQ